MPMIAFSETGAQVRVNFGTSTFAYDIKAHDWSAKETVVSRKSTNSATLVEEG